MRLGERRYRACGFVASGGWAPSSGLLFSHPIPVSIREFALIGAEVLGITEDHGISGWF